MSLTQNVNVQFVAFVEQWRVSNGGSHSCNSYRAHWFPRCHFLCTNGHRCWECPSCPVGLGVCSSEPWISEDQIVWPHIGDVKAKYMWGFPCEYFQFGEMRQTSSSVWGSICILEFSWYCHKTCPEFMLRPGLEVRTLSGILGHRYPKDRVEGCSTSVPSSDNRF